MTDTLDACGTITKQHIAKKVLKKHGENIKMISKEYQEVLSLIHSGTKFGKRSKIPEHLKKFISKNHIRSMIDFGCGKGQLIDVLKHNYPTIDIMGYDPCNPKFNVPLKKVDLIFSTDVLEHIEPNHLDKTLQEIKEHSDYVYHLISCAPAKLILPDGRNAHLIQQEPEWWKQKHLDLGYEIIKEEYRSFSKHSKQLGRSIPVKNYFIMAKLT